MQFPKVTVVVNTFNRCHLLPRALDSVLLQHKDFPDFEVIVVDDASTDDTPLVMASYEVKFTDLHIPYRCMSLSANSGAQAVPKNQGVIYAKGDWLKFLDDDNMMAEGALKALHDAAMEGDVWPDVVYGRRLYKCDEGFTPPNDGRIWSGESTFVEHNPDILAASPSFNYIDGGDALIARGVFWWLEEHTGMMWNERWRRFGDWELFCRMANLDKLVGATPPRFKAIDKVVQVYHWHGANIQLTRGITESPVAKSAITGQVFD